MLFEVHQCFSVLDADQTGSPNFSSKKVVSLEHICCFSTYQEMQLPYISLLTLPQAADWREQLVIQHLKPILTKEVSD